ncbi:hypothetical protein ABUW04_33430 [Streptacidiphilus sp. N1-10]|uniref:Uncharacterized protein n=1 Tax=Streptacidiphilus jeojiensis TaxID=3229225 RepID=A0ABV6XY30_9ACTN
MCTARQQPQSIRNSYGANTRPSPRLCRHPSCAAQGLCSRRSSLLDWSVLLPLPLAEPLVLDLPNAHDDVTVVRSADQALAAARHLAQVIGLPPQTPQHCDNLEIGLWFDDTEATSAAAATHPGAWTEDLDSTFYVATYLRAAQHSLQRHAPISYT